jgi:hypothetical protein
MAVKHLCQSRFVLLWAGVICLLALSCGYDPDRPVYDTTLNPDGFSSDALAVLTAIESDSLSGYAAITDAFGKLYSARPELLDNIDWQSVIQRLGASFRYKADRLASQGLSHYTRAAELYTLAAFARPKDSRSVQQRDLFDIWVRAIEDSLISDSLFRSNKGLGLIPRLRIAKAFVLDDSLSALFANRYMIPPLFYANPQLNLLNIKVLDSLSAPDRAFAAYLNLVQKPGHGRLAAFSNPGIDLLAAEIIPAGPGTWRAAFYFVPRQKIDSGLTVAFRLKAINPTAAGSGEITLDFQPVIPTNRWKSGKVAVAFRTFQYAGPPVECLVGLYDNGHEHPRFAALDGTLEGLHHLPAGIFLAH